MKLLSFAVLVAASLQAAAYPEIPPYVLPPARIAWDDGQDAMGSRLFRTTTLRQQVNLSGWWDFVPDSKDAGESERYFERFPKPEAALWVPGTWNAQPRYWQYVGPGWYRRTFDLPRSGNARIHFSGVFYKVKIWLDGNFLGEHEGSYLPFSFLVRDTSKGAHTLVVRADNRLDDTSLPKRNVDWFPYGGIHRPVYVEMVPDVFVERVHIAPVEIAPGAARLRAAILVRNAGRPVKQKVALWIDGEEVRAEERDIAAGTAALEFDFAVRQPRLWSPEEPNLYSARAVVGDDDQFARFGIREVVVRGNQILLNGRRIKLRGVNRHEDHPEWGSAVPAHLVRQDIEIIKRLGANAVRSHYPPAEMFLDFCDQNGLLFLDEVPSWQYRREQLAAAEIQQKIKRHFREMVERDGGHPSILTWSLGNEWPEPDKSYEVIRSLVEYARGIDRSHIITFVTGGPTVWRVHELVDVICVNWAKFQWYDPATDLNQTDGEKSTAELERIHQRYPDKPVILTEFGGAEAQAGWHSWGNVKWSEEYQARNVEDSGRYALEQDWLSGGCVWQYSDTRSAPERILAGRLHGWNAKGIVDAQRNPKLAFYRLQELFSRY
ncbi:MAG: glycoside hydrolase family 2 TIM barrel-domain containing protein [Bryobacteraceae bacterium]|jgi:beta-glucuronidase